MLFNFVLLNNSSPLIIAIIPASYEERNVPAATASLISFSQFCCWIIIPLAPLLTEFSTDQSVHMIISAYCNLSIVSNLFFRFSSMLSATFIGVSKCRLNDTFSVDCHGGIDVVMSNGVRFQ